MFGLFVCKQHWLYGHAWNITKSGVCGLSSVMTIEECKCGKRRAMIYDLWRAHQVQLQYAEHRLKDNQ